MKPFECILESALCSHGLKFDEKKQPYWIFAVSINNHSTPIEHYLLRGRREWKQTPIFPPPDIRDRGNSPAFFRSIRDSRLELTPPRAFGSLQSQFFGD
jgi:hypothetical protein